MIAANVVRGELRASLGRSDARLAEFLAALDAGDQAEPPPSAAGTAQRSNGRWPRENPAAPRAPLQCPGVLTQSLELGHEEWERGWDELHASIARAMA